MWQNILAPLKSQGAESCWVTPRQKSWRRVSVQLGQPWPAPASLWGAMGGGWVAEWKNKVETSQMADTSWLWLNCKVVLTLCLLKPCLQRTSKEQNSRYKEIRIVIQSDMKFRARAVVQVEEHRPGMCGALGLVPDITWFLKTLLVSSKPKVEFHHYQNRDTFIVFLFYLQVCSSDIWTAGPKDSLLLPLLGCWDRGGWPSV